MMTGGSIGEPRNTDFKTSSTIQLANTIFHPNQHLMVSRRPVKLAAKQPPHSNIREPTSQKNYEIHC